MARKLIIENLMKLASEIGANPNKYMGTKTNINFLGTGDKAMKGTTFGGPLRDDFLEIGVSQDDLIKVVEQDMGYVTSGKLNDSQLKVMTDNLTMARDTLKPVPPTNLFDIATGTGNMNKQGLESLRKGSSLQNVKPVNYSGELNSVPNESGYSGMSYAIKNPTKITDKISKDINRLKVQKTGFAKKDEVGDSPAQALDRGFMEAEGARRAVLRQALLKDENALKSLPDGVIDSLKNSKDLMEKANSGNDPLILFRAIYGDAIDVNKIDDIIASEPFGDVDSIANKVLAFLKQGDNFADGGRIGYRSGRSVTGIMNLIKSKFGKDSIKVADDMDRPESALLRDEFAAFNERNAVPAMEGSFTKAEVVIERMKNSLKNALGKTDADSKYVKETFPNMIKELEVKPELGNNPNVWKMFSEDLPKNQRVVVHSDDSVSFFRQSNFGPQNIKTTMKFAKENNISVKEASRILKMEPEDRILEITRLKAIRQMKKGGLARILEM